MLEGLKTTDLSTPNFIGIGLDSCVLPLRHQHLNLIQTTDFFYPLIDDPFVMGQIACCNVLSDLYAMGVLYCDNMLMLLGLSTAMTAEESDVAGQLLLAGFKATADEAGTSIQGGQTVKNPWLIIGGVATSICTVNDFIAPGGAQPDDVLVLTKPLGNQVAVSAYNWIENYRIMQLQKSDGVEIHLEQERVITEQWENCHSVVDDSSVMEVFDRATKYMCQLNRTGAELMHKHGAHGATDVTGFGVLGHAQNLAEHQTANVSFHLERLPILKHMATIDRDLMNHRFKLAQGYSAETSGGLLIALSPDDVDGFCNDYTAETGCPVWKIGRVVRNGTTKNTERRAYLSDELEILNV